MHIRAALGLALPLAAACLPTHDPGAGATSSSTTGSSTSGELPSPTTSGTTTIDPTTTTTGSTTDPTTGVEGPACGDGHLDLGEDCDLGADNSNNGACTLQCDPATCGDGLLWIGAEDCDFGPGNVGEYGGCRPDCTWAPRCSDGQLDEGFEECDLGLLNGTGMGLEDMAPCSLTCRWQGRLVFLSSATYDGALGGLSGADLRCRNLATAAGLENPLTFRAWLSDGLDSPLSRFEQVDLQGAPYVLPNGRMIAADFTELIEQGPRTGIALTETGAYLTEQLAWTNTSPFGEPFSAADHCDGWISDSFGFAARSGFNAVELEMGPEWEAWRDERQWTSALGSLCDKTRRLYCFEDGELED
ncbi:hypothetical protein [Nannocystis pusilla]|uniref:hypothetical protein n=1 Tax=Nannocystis pusilla TaxID=889268 RepID=UPI003B7F89E8